MSLMKSLAKVAAGVMLAKGIGAVMQGQKQGRSGGSSSGGLLGSLFGNNTGGQGGSVSQQLGQALGGRGSGSARPYGGPGSTGAQSGLGGLLDGLSGQGGILGQLTGGGASGRSGSGDGLGDMLGGLLGAAYGLAKKDSQFRNDAHFGELFNDSLASGDEPEIVPTPEQNAAAGLMLKAMIQAAKSDGRIDESEKQRLLGHLGDDLDNGEREFIREQMALPVDAAALAREVPQGLEAQVYLMSLMAIDFDNQEEARYLHTLAQAMNLRTETVNQIHDKVGVVPLYS